MNNFEKLTQDIAEIIVKYNKCRQSAPTNKTAYEVCEALMSKLHHLTCFAKTYCRYEIEIITAHNGSQYIPEGILGFSIIEADGGGEDGDSD